jgi:ABC-type lipoprotein export system ATPase subunit
MLELTGLNKSFRRNGQTIQALRDVSLRVEDGKFVALHGPSGCGKTTLLLACGALQAPDSGEVRLDGASPYALGPNARARFRAKHVGFVFQQFHLVPYLNVAENILAASLAVPDPNARTRAAELMDRLGLASRAAHRPAELSTGERQRVALARALLNGPGLILADEPTGNLDEANAREVLAALAELAAAGKTVLLVTHDTAAAAYAHQTVHMRDGRIVP